MQPRGGDGEEGREQEGGFNQETQPCRGQERV